MNEKFWDLKKSKQNNMINGALKVFAGSGFRHASTDEIVAEASVSKGLLFHYFYSKTGLYEFLTEYCARFALVELASEIRKQDSLPFFELQNRLTRAQSRVMRQYPCLFLFLESAGSDTSFEKREEVLANIALYTDKLSALEKDAVLPVGMTASDAARISRMLHLVRLSAAGSLLSQGPFSPDKYSAEVSEYVRLFEEMYK